MKKSYLLAAVIFIIALGWILTGQFGEPIHKAEELKRDLSGSRTIERPTPVRVREIYATPHARELVLFGRTEADRKVSLRARTDGLVEALPIDEGASVALEASIIQLAMEDRKAKLAEAKATEQQYRLAYEAGKNLSQKSFRSRVTLAENKADWEASKAQLEAAKLDVDHTDIRAPFGGVVDSIDVEVGDYVQEGDTVAMVVDLDPLVISAQVTERDVFYLLEGGKADVHLANGEKRAGTVRYISRAGNTETRTFRIEVAVPNSDYSAAEGLTAEVRLKMGTTQAHLVTPAVLTLSEEGAVGVKAVDADNKVVFFPTQMVADTPEGIWLGGLPNPVKLITVGQEFVREGQAVDPVLEKDLPNESHDPESGENGPKIVAPKTEGDAS